MFTSHNTVSYMHIFILQMGKRDTEKLSNLSDTMCYAGISLIGLSLENFD